MNNRIPPKERNLIKGALRRVFSRSELRRKVLDTADIVHSDPSRPRVKKWSLCPKCRLPNPKYLMAVDHIQPVVPTNKTLEDMTWDELIDNLWCESNNLQIICPSCHTQKSAVEREERKLNRKGKKENVERKVVKRTSPPSRKRNSPRSTKSRTIRTTKKTYR